MSQLPLVSIITIVYNGEKHLEHTIQSVLSQTYRNIEYIVIDGGSTDNTLPIIRRYEQQLAYWISEKDNGISDAFNKGLRKASGEIIGIINADDWYEQDTVEKVVTHIADNDITYGDLHLYKTGQKDFILKGNHHYLNKEMTINHPTVFIRKICYDHFGLFDEQYKCAMDYELLLRMMIQHCKFEYIPSVLANMRWEGMSDTKWLLGCRETLAIKNIYFPSHRIRNKLYFYKHILAIAVPKFLQKLNMDWIIKTYRTRFSRVKKEYD